MSEISPGQSIPLSFAEHKEVTGKDIESVCANLTELAAKIRDGDMDAFERFWIEGGTEEGDAKIDMIVELIVLRYLARKNRVALPLPSPEVK